MSGIEWDEPPAEVVNGVRSGAYTELAAALRANPGKWAKMPGERTQGGASSTAQNVRRGSMKDFPKGQFDAVHKAGVVWVKCLSPEEAEAEAAVDGVPASVIRQWAKGSGIEIGDRGRLSPEVVAAYHKSNDSPDT